MSRKGARRRSDVPADVLAALNAGTLEAASLAEGLAVDFQALLAAAPGLPPEAAAAVRPDLGVTARMAAAGRVLINHGGLPLFSRLAAHPSDTVRGWAAYLLAADPGPSLAERLARTRVLADDPHFGVREWAWLALRPRVAADVRAAVELLRPWASEPSANVRRFASEVTRPRGVWCAHIAELKADPGLGLPVLEPLRDDPSRYVQNSVANWLNDAAKTRPDWVRAVCGRWLAEGPSPATAAICRRGMRGVGAA